MRLKGLAIVAILMTSVVAAAVGSYAELTVTPKTADIPVGTTGTYALTLDTDFTGSTSLRWDTSDPSLLASINGDPFAQSGTYSFTSTGGVQTFTLDIKPVAGIVVNQKYKTHITFLDQSGDAEAMVTAGTIPTPEVATGILMSAGLLGLVGLMRYRRK